MVNVLFILSGFLWSIELFPQLVRTYRTKQVGDFSILFPLMCFSGFVLFLTACFLSKQWIILFSHLLPFINLCILITFILIYRRKR